MLRALLAHSSLSLPSQPSRKSGWILGLSGKHRCSGCSRPHILSIANLKYYAQHAVCKLYRVLRLLADQLVRRSVGETLGHYPGFSFTESAHMKPSHFVKGYMFLRTALFSASFDALHRKAYDWSFGTCPTSLSGTCSIAAYCSHLREIYGSGPSARGAEATTIRRHVLHAQLLGHDVLYCRTGFHLSRLKSQRARARK